MTTSATSEAFSHIGGRAFEWAPFDQSAYTELPIFIAEDEPGAWYLVETLPRIGHEMVLKTLPRDLDLSGNSSSSEINAYENEAANKLWAAMKVADDEQFEDGEDSLLARRLRALYSRFGEKLIEAVPAVFEAPRIRTAACCEVLMQLGAIDDGRTSHLRLALLTGYLNAKSPQLRFAAVRGLAELGSPAAAPALRRALTVERNSLLRRTIEAALIEVS